MLTVPEAARRVGRDPETVRRWIRSGRLASRKVGTQYVIDETDLETMLEDDEELPVPSEWNETWTGEPPFNAVRALRLSRTGR